MSVKRGAMPPTITSHRETLNASILLAVGVNPLTNAFNLLVQQVIDWSEANTRVQVRLVIANILNQSLIGPGVNSEGLDGAGLDVRNLKEHDSVS